MKQYIQLTVRLPKDLHAQLTQIAAQEDRSLNKMLILLVRQSIENQEGNLKKVEGYFKQ